MDVVLTKNKEFAKRYIQDYVNKNKDIGCRIIKISETHMMAQLINGETIEWINPDFNRRGYRIDDAYVDIALTLDEIKESIVGRMRYNDSEIVLFDSREPKLYDLDRLINDLQKVRLLKGNIDVLVKSYDDSLYMYEIKEELNGAITLSC